LIERNHESLFAASSVPTQHALALACAAMLLQNTETRMSSSPWDGLSHWRMAGPYREHISWRDLDAVTDAADANVMLQTEFQTEFHTGASEQAAKPERLPSGSGANARLAFGDKRPQFQWSRGAGPHDVAASLDDVRVSGRVFIEGDAFHVFMRQGARRFVWQDPLAQLAQAAEGEGRLTAPMPGKIIAILVAAGESVERDAPLLVMEAMKMEHTIVAPGSGVVGDVLFAVGDQVSEGSQLLTMVLAT
jgi:3-methylcrotonyl-CoA carboxylase alpha subunit